MENITLNFGAIKETIIRLINSDLLVEDKEQITSLFKTEIKNNDILYRQYLFFKSIELCKPFNKEILAERFLKQLLNIPKTILWNDLTIVNKELIRKFLGTETHVGSSSGNDTLFNDIHTTFESSSKKMFKPEDFNRFQKSYESIIKYLCRESNERNLETSEYPNLLDRGVFTKNNYNNFNKRFSHLNDSEREILKTLI